MNWDTGVTGNLVDRSCEKVLWSWTTYWSIALRLIAVHIIKFRHGGSVHCLQSCLSLKMCIAGELSYLQLQPLLFLIKRGIVTFRQLLFNAVVNVLKSLKPVLWVRKDQVRPAVLFAWFFMSYCPCKITTCSIVSLLSHFQVFFIAF